MPKVSIIIPVYNVEKYIERCAHSLFEQTLDDIEFIFVDDCTPDNSMDIVKSILLGYPQRQTQVTFVKHETNIGLPATRNSGLEVATGDFIAHCDSDDWVDRNMYKELYLEAIAKKADIAICNMFFAKKSNLEEYQVPLFTSDKESFLKDYIIGGMTSLCNMLVRRDLYLKNLAPVIGINYCEDFILSVKLLHKANKVVHINKALYYYNQQNEGSLLRSRRKEAEIEEICAYLNVIDYFKQEGDYPLYAKQLSWRILKAKQEWILSPEKHNVFLNTYPQSHKYILSNPMINYKLKIMMVCKIHHLGWITNGIIFLRNLLKR